MSQIISELDGTLGNTITTNRGVVQCAELIFTGPALGGTVSGFGVGVRYLIVNCREFFERNQTPGTFYIDCNAAGGGASRARSFVDMTSF